MKYAVLIGMILVAANGCGGVSPSAPETAFLVPDRDVSCSQPMKLVVGVNEIYCKKTACECVHYIANRDFGTFCAMLKKKHNIELELVYFPEDMWGLEKAVSKGKFDAVLAKPWSILRAACKSGRKLTRVADLHDPDNKTELRGLIVSLSKSKYKTLASMEGARFAMGQADAYEKHQALVATFKKAGVVFPHEKCIQRSSCLECVNDLLSGKVDGAVVSDYAFDADCLIDVAKPEDFHIIAKTDEVIPLTSLMVDTGKLSQDQIIRLRRALLDCSGKNAPKEMRSKGFCMPRPWSPKIEVENKEND